jgi:hypothetical protein
MSVSAVPKRSLIEKAAIEGGFPMSEFVLLYRDSKEARSQRQSSPEIAQQEVKKWQAWFKDMTEKGQLKNLGQPLEFAGKVIGGKKKAITDGPFSESKDIIGGYSVIEARDLDEAAKIGSGCPIIEAGGKVEVRPVLQMKL